MVVDEVSDAQACIEYLRKNSVGRASFMVLKKLKSYGMDKVATPENVPRLFDLVKPNDPSYAPAFFKAIGNTLVANDMDQANRIAFGRHRWRVVTLAGGLIETSGAMSGGGSQVSRGGMSSKQAAAVSPQLLRTYEKDSEDAANRLQKATAELREAEMEFERLSTRGPEIDMAYQKLGLDIENVKKRIVEAEKRVKDLGYVYPLLSISLSECDPASLQLSKQT
jgi:structural maintenance of chromosome 4